MTGTTTDTISQTGAMLGADELRWALEPSARLEDARAEDLLALDPSELLTYAADCREDLRAVRETLSRAIALVAQQRDQLARAARVAEALRREYATFRAQQKAAA